MTKDSLTIHAQLLPVGRDFQAKMGDRILIVAGLAVGIYTGDTNVPLSMGKETRKTTVPPFDTRPDSADTTQAKKSGGTRSKPHGTYLRKDGTPTSAVNTVIHLVRDKLREAKGEWITKHDIVKLTLPTGYAPSEWQVRDAIAYLKHLGECEAKRSGAGGLAQYKAGPNLRIEQRDTP